MNWISSYLTKPVLAALGSDLFPKEIQNINRRLADLTNALRNDDQSNSLKHDDLSLVKRVLIFQRRKIHEEQEKLRLKTMDPELHRTIDGLVETVNTLIDDPEFRQIDALSIPALTKFVTLKVAYDILEPTLKHLPEYKFEEKFGILQSPSIMLDSLDHYRHEGWLRNTGLSVAFIDIDDFKKFNTKHTETFVDQNILPRVMQTIEAQVYAHGRGFRHGGDEFVLLLPNSSFESSKRLLEELQEKLGELKIRGVSDTISVSIGFCSIPVDSFLTNIEVLEAANRAKQFAKKAEGKGRIGIYGGNQVGDSTFQLLEKRS